MARSSDRSSRRDRVLGFHLSSVDGGKSETPHVDLMPGVLPTLLVAAKEQLRASVVPMLEAEGYLVLEAGSETEALQAVIGQARTIHILLADIDMDGHKLAKDLIRYRPGDAGFLDHIRFPEFRRRG